MRKTSGAYVRDSFAAGVLINSQHPPARQRYTAAHELAHHLLNHASTTDAETGVLRELGGVVRLRDSEMVAEAFAAWFLMPRPLVQAGLRRLGLLSPSTAAHVYQLALRLGTSYAATATHLPNLRSATTYQADEWLETVRKRGLTQLKHELAGGPLTNNRADVWLLGAGDAGHACHVRPGDRLVVCLDEVPSSGYVWELKPPAGWSVLSNDSAVATVADAWAAGQEARRRFLLDVPPTDAHVDELVTGPTVRLSATQRRPWDPTDTAATWSTELTLTLPRLGFDERQLELQAA